MHQIFYDTVSFKPYSFKMGNLMHNLIQNFDPQLQVKIVYINQETNVVISIWNHRKWLS